MTKAIKSGVLRWSLKDKPAFMFAGPLFCLPTAALPDVNVP